MEKNEFAFFLVIDVALSKALLCPKLYSCKQNREL